MTPIEELWQQFSSSVLPPGVTEIQRKEMRRAFFAGFSSAVAEVAGTQEKFSDTLSLELLKYTLQVSAFTDEVLSGRA